MPVYFKTITFKVSIFIFDLLIVYTNIIINTLYQRGPIQLYILYIHMYILGSKHAEKTAVHKLYYNIHTPMYQLKHILYLGPRLFANSTVWIFRCTMLLWFDTLWKSYTVTGGQDLLTNFCTVQNLPTLENGLSLLSMIVSAIRIHYKLCTIT